MFRKHKDCQKRGSTKARPTMTNWLSNKKNIHPRGLGCKTEYVFYNRDDVSRLTAGKTQTVTKMKAKKQKRFLWDNLRNLHKLFLIENPETEISYSLFCHMKPFWVVTPTNTDRETCLCKVHENIKFLVEKLHHHKVIDSTNLESIVKATCYSAEKKEYISCLSRGQKKKIL